MSIDSIPWTKKHLPRSIGGICGQQEATAALLAFVRGFDAKHSRKKAALLFGPVGCGKTCSVYAVASELGLEVLETNASDFRNADGITSTAGNASRQLSLFNRGKIILIDEIDGISGQQDRGGIGAIQELIEKSAFPVVMTANDPSEKKFAPLRKASQLIEYKQLSTSDVRNALSSIVHIEKLKADAEALDALASRSSGDLRGSITDLQLLFSGNNKLTKEAVSELSERNRLENVESALLRVFKTTDIHIAAEAFDKVELQPEECFAWIDENIPSEYTKVGELAEAYEALSVADLFRSRIMSRQHWRLLSYFIQIMTIGTALAKEKKYDGIPLLSRPSRGLKVFIAKMKHQKKVDIAVALAEIMHTTKDAVLSDTLPFLKIIFSRGNESELQSLALNLGLASEEVEWLRKT